MMTTAAGYAALSRRYAADGELRMAQLAAWASDVHTLEQLLAENGIDQAPDPAAQLAAVGSSVAASVEAAAAALPDRSLSAREVVEVARAAMVATFDASVHDLLAQRLGGLGHLEGVLAGPTITGATADRLRGRTADELWQDLRTAAADCSTMADLLAAEGADQAADRLSRQADAAAYEAYLVLAATRAGDVSFATVDLRWDLLTQDELPARRRFAGAVGAAERGSLEASLGTT
jgi:hypothetical protein